MCFSNLRASHHAISQKVHPCKKGPWLNDLCPHERQYNPNNDQDKDAFQDKLESPLVLNLCELDWLKGNLG